jgi:hypothetical protein
MLSKEKWPPATPPCNFCQTMDTGSNYKTQKNLLSCPNMYGTPF